MKTFIVTRTTVKTFVVSAEDSACAENFVGSGGGLNIDYAETICAREKLAAPEYRIVVYEDLNYQISAEDAESARYEQEILSKNSAYGYMVENRVTKDGDWEHVESCFGFLGNDTDSMFEQAASFIPKGIEANVVNEDRSIIRQVYGTGK